MSFPDAIERLNLSGNAIVRITGVAFPASLTHLSLNALAPIVESDASLTSQESVLEEFEVRQTDATLFATLKTASFDVAPTTTTRVTCSDTRAKRVYVRDTMLCVLPDDVFTAKYGDASSTSNGVGATDSGSTSGATAQPLAPVDESFDQSRSWFLLVGALALSGFVVCFFGAALCRVGSRRLGVQTASTDATKPQHTHQQQELLRREHEERPDDNVDSDGDEPESRAVA